LSLLRGLNKVPESNNFRMPNQASMIGRREIAPRLAGLVCVCWLAVQGASAASDHGNEVTPAKFTDITSQAGITFVHNNGVYGDKLLPETMGGGVAFFDFDNDGNQDLLFVNGTSWPWKQEKASSTAALYRNDGTGRFEDVTRGSGLDVSFYETGVAVGDYDNDGFVDVFISG